MNLIKDAWIPVSYNNGTKNQVSLTDYFKDSENIVDFVLNPTERVGIFSFILAIVHTALDGPEDYEDWYKCKSKIIETTLDYLDKHYLSFDLFGEFSAFQMFNLEPKSKDLKTTGTYPQYLDKICYEIAAGNNPSFFDKKTEPLVHDYAWVARQIFSYQSFDCGGTHSTAIWNGKAKPGGKGSFKASPRFGALHTFIIVEDMLSTIHMNLLNKETIKRENNLDWGYPVWEKIPKGYTDVEARENLTGSYLGMLVPVSRTIKIHEDGVHCVLGNGFTYDNYSDNSIRIPTTTVVERKGKGKKIEYNYLKLKTGKHPWRDLGSICSIKDWDPDTETRHSPLALNNIYYLLDIQGVDKTRPNFVIWAGQVNNDKSKILGKSEWRLVIESLLLYNTENEEGEPLKQRPFDAYRAGVAFAEMSAYKLTEAVIKYYKGCGNKIIVDKYNSKSRLQIVNNITVNFWYTLDMSYSLLMKESLDTKDLKETQWYKLVIKTALKTFTNHCPTFSSKTIKAYVEGFQEIYNFKGERTMKKGKIDIIAEDFIKILKAQVNNREIMSKFKQLIRNDVQGVNSSVSLFPLEHLKDKRLREAYYITAFMFAHNPRISTRKTFGHTVRQLAQKYSSYDLRFNALLGSFDRQELRERLKSMIHVLANTETPVNYQRLFTDIYYWGDVVKREWGIDFWADVKN